MFTQHWGIAVGRKMLNLSIGLAWKTPASITVCGWWGPRFPSIWDPSPRRQTAGRYRGRVARTERGLDLALQLVILTIAYVRAYNCAKEKETFEPMDAVDNWVSLYRLRLRTAARARALAASAALRTLIQLSCSQPFNFGNRNYLREHVEGNQEPDVQPDADEPSALRPQKDISEKGVIMVA